MPHVVGQSDPIGSDHDPPQRREGSEEFVDYRDQLLSWEEGEPKVAQYCQRLNLLMTAEGFVEYLRTRRAEMTAEVDRTRESNQEVMIGEYGGQFSRNCALNRRLLDALNWTRHITTFVL